MTTMNRTARTAWIGAAICVSTMGCAHFFETQTVARLTAALEDQDVEFLKSATTDEFQHMVLRHPKAGEDLKTLNRPHGRVRVVKVEEIMDRGRVTEKKITVEIGKNKRREQFHLVKDEKTGDWKLADITIRQIKPGQMVDVQQLTGLMDLLITPREFLEAWDLDERKDILAVVTPRLRKELQRLPAPALAQLAEQIVGKRTRTEKWRHVANPTIQDDVAQIMLTRGGGKVALVCRRIDGKWLVDDVAAESRGDAEHLPSLLKQAVVMRVADEFLSAYAASDQASLARVCTNKFYGESLKYSNLSEMPLQVSRDAKPMVEVTVQKTRAVYSLKTPQRWLRVAMVLTEKSDANAPTQYLIEDVAVHDLRRQQETRVSSFFTARAKAQLFADAIARGNLNVLSKISTGDFRRRVWDDVDATTMRTLPALGLDRPGLTVEATIFRGSITEIHGRQNGHDVTYLLRERQGIVEVDDVQVLEYGKPRSLKSMLELTIPIRKFAAALEKSDIQTLQRNSSRDLNRLIWKQTRAVPNSARTAPRYLTQPITSATPDGQDMIVKLGDDRQGAKVFLVKESSKYVVHDAILIDSRSKEPLRLKKAMRAELARTGALLPDPSQIGRNKTLIQPATDELGFRSSGLQGRVTHAAHRHDPLGEDLRRAPLISVDPQAAAFQDVAPARRIAGRPRRRIGRAANELDELLN